MALFVIINWLISIERSKRFGEFVLKQIHAQLAAEEQHVLATSTTSKVNDWVPKEALEMKHLPSYGTFDEALVQCVEEKLKPTWANLIMETDLNHNLLLVYDAIESGDDHQLDLWLSCLEVACSSSTDVANMVARIGKCTFPFSQHVIMMVDSIISESSSLGEHLDEHHCIFGLLCFSFFFCSRILS